MRSLPFLFTMLLAFTSAAQDLDPRAYVKLPIRGTVLIVGYAHSKGGVVTDPTLPLENLEAKVDVATVGVARTFGLAGHAAQALIVLPYGWLSASALANGQPQYANRSGFVDMRARLSVLLLGGKAVTLRNYAKDSTRTLIGTSLTVVAPTGQYLSGKLINLGTSRWSFKPEIALSQKLGKRWMLDFFTGVWLFTTNDSFFPGNSVRTQEPLVSFQSHLSYNISPRTWVAFASTFYAGGQSSVDDVIKDDRQSNVRLGATLAMPVGKRSVLKIAYSSGAVVRIGANFHTLSIGLSSTWFSKSKSDE